MAYTIAYASTKAKLDQVDPSSGRITFVEDERAIYLDYSKRRIPFQQIITLHTDLARTSLAVPLRGFYFVEETHRMWEWDGTQWIEVCPDPVPQIVYMESEEFPVVGDPYTLYIDETKIYRYLNGSYTLLNSDSGGGGGGSVWIYI